MRQTLSVTVKGKVQGVFFRQSARQAAEALQLSGTVRNLPDGSVQVVATGAPEKLDALLDWCKTGPPKAAVAGVSHQFLPLQEFTGFTVIR